MNARMETIRRLAESDPYWRGYLDGVTAAHHDDGAAREYARLAQARLDRNADTTDYDSEWRMVAPVISHEEYVARLRYRKRKAAQAAEGDWDWDNLNA